MHDERAQADQQQDRQPKDARQKYEPPRLEPLGTMVELTEGMGPLTLDLSGLRAASSDRALKENFEAVDPHAVLDAVRALPVETWNYISDEPSTRHIGPMSQEFAAAFAVGADDRQISLVDANGVCLAAVQALAARVEALEAELAGMRAGSVGA